MIRSLRALAGAMLFFAAAASAETRWFVVAEREPGGHGDSFLLPLSDPEHIAQARARIARGDASGVGSIASVRLAAGTDGINRDLRAPGTPLWSWHVAEFEGFVDNAIELCDGWPGFIEEDVDAFLRNTDSRACFWGYSVVEELAAAPPFAIHDVVEGAWHDPATPGQGIFVTVLPGRRLFVGWFTFEQPGVVVPADTQHRWFTAQGGYAGGRADLVLHHTRGGVFARPVPVETAPVGTLRLDFSDCAHATATYAFDGGPSGTLALVPVAGDCAR